MFKKLWEDNWTHIWGSIKISLGAAIAILSPTLNNPEVKEYIHQMNLPLWTGLILAILGAITLASMDHKD